MSKSSKILFAISALIMLIGLSIGISYILTGKTTEWDKKTVFMGHMLDDNGHIIFKTGGWMPEKLSFISLGVITAGAIPFMIALIREGKGMSKMERKLESKKTMDFQVGMFIAIICSFVLVFLTPKGDWEMDKYHSWTWYLIIMIVEFIAIGTIIIGLTRGYKATRGSLI